MSIKPGILLFILSYFAYPATAQLSISPIFDGLLIAENTWYVSTKGDSVQFYTSDFICPIFSLKWTITPGSKTP